MQTSASDIRITLPRPHPAQQEIIDGAARFNAVACGRRFGKTTLGRIREITPELLPLPVAWCSPSYKMMIEVWRDFAQVLSPIIKRKNIQERRIENIAGGVIEFWSLDNADAMRGRKYAHICIDEAAQVTGLLDIWQYILRPTLVDYSGGADFYSTPRGRNGFWQLFQQGVDDSHPDWRAWQMPTAANPHIPPGEIEEMRLTLPERIYQQEVMAQFIDDTGGVFRHVMESVDDKIEPGWQPNQQYVIGVDWGKYTDFTVLTVIDIRKNTVVEIDRFNRIDYAVQRGRLMRLVDEYKPTVVIAESNSMGDAVIEQLQREGIPVQPFLTTNATKKQIIDGLALAFERGSIRIPNDPVLIGELMAFEMDRTAAGNLRYNAPSGMHDDCVMSLALAWSATGAAPMVLAGASGKKSTWGVDSLGGRVSGSRWRTG